MSASYSDPAEVRDKLRKRYLDRLAERMRKMRKDLVDRNWTGLRAECRQLRGTAESFGFDEIMELAGRAELSIPSGGATRAQGMPQAKQAVDALITAIDGVLTEHSVVRSAIR